MDRVAAADAARREAMTKYADRTLPTQEQTQIQTDRLQARRVREIEREALAIASALERDEARRLAREAQEAEAQRQIQEQEQEMERAATAARTLLADQKTRRDERYAARKARQQKGRKSFK